MPRHKEDKELLTVNLWCTKNLGLGDRRELTFGLTLLGKLCALAQGQPARKGVSFSQGAKWRGHGDEPEWKSPFPNVHGGAVELTREHMEPGHCIQLGLCTHDSTLHPWFHLCGFNQPWAVWDCRLLLKKFHVEMDPYCSRVSCTPVEPPCPHWSCFLALWFVYEVHPLSDTTVHSPSTRSTDGQNAVCPFLRSKMSGLFPVLGYCK